MSTTILRTSLATPLESKSERSLFEKIESANSRLEKRFKNKLVVNADLKRTLVSFQANKKVSGYRWYKFKEGYSSELVNYVIDKLGISGGKVIDPFAGSGASLFASSERGLETLGIELLPIGIEIMEVRKMLLKNKDFSELVGLLNLWIEKKPWIKEKGSLKLNELKITAGAFPKKTDKLVSQYMFALNKLKNSEHKRILRFALLCIMEEISFTRKDGQYLRWDHRSGRGSGKTKFDKGEIKDFNQSILKKLTDIRDDLKSDNALLSSVHKSKKKNGSVKIVQGSCLTELPKLSSNEFDFLMTSPPYCNRYDYTRTYALELALLGVDEIKIRELRQTMMTCTVENKEKENLDQVFSREAYREANKAFEDQEALQAILRYLEDKKNKKELNNPGISRMVKNYFYETALIIFESARILKRGAPFVMVNDNVRYAGANIPVDLILSDIAEKAGFQVEAIWVLPTGKGNSSQQMGEHGRDELRKCVYVWRKL